MRSRPYAARAHAAESPRRNGRPKLVALAGVASLALLATPTVGEAFSATAQSGESRSEPVEVSTSSPTPASATQVPEPEQAPSIGSFQWEVADAADPDVLLADATWEVWSGNDLVRSIEDCVADSAKECAGESDASPVRGRFITGDLEVGDYALYQVDAAEGFLPAEDPVEFSITESDLDPEADDKILNEGIQSGEDEDVDESEDSGDADGSPESEGQRESTDDAAISPLALGPDGASPPYVYWTVEDTDGNLVGGASFNMRFRTSNFGNWTNGNTVVTDCVEASPTGCTGLDKDPDAGEFLVKQIHHGRNRTHDVSYNNGANWYSAQRTNTTPAGYTWVTSTAWVDSNNWMGSDTNRTMNLGVWNLQKVAPGTYQPKCQAGYIYAISAAGQLQQVTPAGVVSNMGTSANSTNMNGLGVGPSGEPVYAIQRSSTSGTNQNGTVWKYDTTTGVWTSTGVNSGNTGTNLIGGAVDLSTGTYYFGGFTDNGDFKVYEYNPSPGSTSLKATITTTATSSANGDIAFDAAGNFYIVRGSGNSSIVYSVPAATFQSASGGTISSSDSSDFTTSTDVNGIAFDSAGKAYLGSSSQLRSYDMPNWTNGATITSGLSSTDLATCSSPPTIVIEKEIVGGRVNTGDQFKMTLNQGGTLLGTATTTGSDPGVQEQRIGPLPTVRGVALSFAETAAGTTNMNNYASAYQCTVTHMDGTVQNLGQVSGTSGSVTIPATGEAVRCVFRNSPLVADVTIHKDVTDASGENPEPRAGWTVELTASQTTGTVDKDPSSDTLSTNADGDANWSLRFDTYSSRATVNVSEVMQDGYAFQSGSCTVTSLSGSTTTTALNGPNAQALTDIAPGDSVDCTYVNRPSVGQIEIAKAFEDVPEGSGDIDFTGTYTCTLGSETVASGTWSSQGKGSATLTPATGSPDADKLPVGAECSAAEDPLPTDPAEIGLPNSSWQWGTPTVSDPVTVSSTHARTITVTNTAERVYGNFSVTKVIPEGSVADATNVYNGDWECALGDEQVTGTWSVTGPDTWTSTDADKIPLGANCSVLNETRPDSPVATDPSYEWDGDPQIGSSVAAVAGETVSVVTVTNKTSQVLGSVTWTKTDESGNTLLGKSEWLLTGPGGYSQAIVDNQDLDVDLVSGQFKIVDLAWGEYTLTETKPPAGYALDSTEHKFTIGNVDPAQIEYNLGAIKNRQREAPKLPLTGGQTAAIFIVLGGGLLGAASGTAYVLRRRTAK